MITDKENLLIFIQPGEGPPSRLKLDDSVSAVVDAAAQWMWHRTDANTDWGPGFYMSNAPSTYHAALALHAPKYLPVLRLN